MDEINTLGVATEIHRMTDEELNEAKIILMDKLLEEVDPVELAMLIWYVTEDTIRMVKRVEAT